MWRRYSRPTRRRNEWRPAGCSPAQAGAQCRLRAGPRPSRGCTWLLHRPSRRPRLRPILAAAVALRLHPARGPAAGGRGQGADGDFALPRLPGPVDRRQRRRHGRRHARPGARADQGGREAGGDPALAGRALRRLGELQAAGRAAHLAALGGAAAAGRGSACTSPAAASGGRRADGLADPHDPRAGAPSPRSGASAGSTAPACSCSPPPCCSRSPAMPGRAAPASPAAPRRRPRRRRCPTAPSPRCAQDMLGRFDTADRWLTIAEGFQRRGDTRGGAGLIRSALRAHPDNAILWIGYGDALVVHSGRADHPGGAARLRTGHALAPDHPAPRFFFGLALAQIGPPRRSGAGLARAARRSAPPDAAVARRGRGQLEQLEAGEGTAEIIPSAPGWGGWRQAGSNGRSSASATAWWRILPPETLRPLARCGSRLHRLVSALARRASERTARWRC